MFFVSSAAVHFRGIRDAVGRVATPLEENYSWKNRLFNPANTVHLFIIQIRNHNTPLSDLPHKSGESFTGSAFCRARQRLPLGVFQRLLRRMADTLLPRSGGAHVDAEGRWFGHRTFSSWMV